jgi:hypothetical protein
VDFVDSMPVIDREGVNALLIQTAWFHSTGEDPRRSLHRSVSRRGWKTLDMAPIMIASH